MIEDQPLRRQDRLKEIKNSPTSGNHRCYTKKNIGADLGYLRDALQDPSGSGGLGRLSEARNRLLQRVLRIPEYRSLL
ncbi:MAG: hypothetical protein Q8M86_06920 [Syntrophales bacterium]|nr:hypothetical protein [Syntrophales bacterium]